MAQHRLNLNGLTSNGGTNIVRPRQTEPSTRQTTVGGNTEKNFVYMDDASLEDDFKCPICLEPFDDPVCTPCDHTFCCECITDAIKYNGDQKCPNCCRESLSSNDLKSVNRIISNKIDRYPVRCLTCGQTNIQRGHFEEHLKKLCSKANVSCPANNVRCPWTGPRDQLQGHISLCLYEQMRPVFSQLLATNESQQEQLNIQAVQLSQIQETLTIQLKKIQVELTKAFTQIKQLEGGDSLLSREHESILNAWIGINVSTGNSYHSSNACRPVSSVRNDYTHNELNSAWTIIYKDSRNGFQPQDFHRICDSKRKTLTIIQSTEGYLFGGYTQAAWNSNSQYIRDPEAFIFTLSNPFDASPTRYAPARGSEANAIYGRSEYGPSFGCSDIHVCSEKECDFGFPNTYWDTTGIGCHIFTGTETCSIKEVEVYQANR